MDFLTYEQANKAKILGLQYPPETDDAFFGMLFEAKEPSYQYAFVGTGQWELFKQHCLNNGVWRATPVDLLRAMPDGWALYIEERDDIRTRWACLNMEQGVFDVLENGLDKFTGLSPIEAVFSAWLSLNKNKQ